MATFTSEKLSHLIRSLDGLERPGSQFRPPKPTGSSFVSIAAPSDHLAALQQTISNLPKSPSRSQLRQALEPLDQRRSGSARSAARASSSDAENEQLLEWTLIGRVVLGMYGQSVEELVSCASAWEEEIGWWKRLDGSGRWAWGGVGGYLFMTLPHRLVSMSRNVLSQPPSAQSWTPTYLLSTLFPSISIPRSTTSIYGPRTLLRMTRREIHVRISDLEQGRDRLVGLLGRLTVEAPDFEDDQVDTDSLKAEMCRVLALIHRSTSGPKEPSSSISALQLPPSASASDPTSFLPAIHSLLKRETLPSSPPPRLTRPSAFTRLWPPLLLLPLLVPLLSPYIPQLKMAVRDGRETLEGFWKGWVLEPVKGIIDTVRHGGGAGGKAGLSVISQEAMRADMESLQRMVVSLAEDKGNYSAAELDGLSARVKEGDLSDVLRLYEEDIKSPVVNAVKGTLVRSLLIQIQKSKVDVDLALSGIDKLLRSQELTFAFVGVAPSFLVVYLVGGWFRGFLSGAGGLRFGSTGQKERRRQSWESIRRIERLLTLPPPPSPEDTEKPTADLPYEIQGLLLVSIASLRKMAKHDFKRRESARKTEFLLDLVDLENPDVNREAKLRVVERMWRCWGKRLEWC